MVLNAGKMFYIFGGLEPQYTYEIIFIKEKSLVQKSGIRLLYAALCNTETKLQTKARYLSTDCLNTQEA